MTRWIVTAAALLVLVSATIVSADAVTQWRVIGDGYVPVASVTEARRAAPVDVSYRAMTVEDGYVFAAPETAAATQSTRLAEADCELPDCSHGTCEHVAAGQWDVVGDGYASRAAPAGNPAMSCC